jgi:phage FluMu gp28-like protein
MYALLAEFRRGNKYNITLKTGNDVAKLADLGWIVFDDPAVLVAEMESGKKMLNMKYEKREQIIAYLRAMTPAVAV